jgi:hypothetical protein
MHAIPCIAFGAVKMRDKFREHGIIDATVNMASGAFERMLRSGAGSCQDGSSGWN